MACIQENVIEIHSDLIFPNLINFILSECKIFSVQPLVWCAALFCQTPLDFIVNILSVCSLHHFRSWPKITLTDSRLWFALGCWVWLPEPSPSAIKVSRILSVGFCRIWMRSIVCNSSPCFPSPPWNILKKKVVI